MDPEAQSIEKLKKMWANTSIIGVLQVPYNIILPPKEKTINKNANFYQKKINKNANNNRTRKRENSLCLV